MTLDPTSVGISCATLPKDHCVQLSWKYIKLHVCGYSDYLLKTWTGQWTPDYLWPHICWGHTWLPKDSCVPLPWKYSNVRVNSWLFSKTFKQNINDSKWSLDDLWSHLCWGYMCVFYPRIFVSNSHGNTLQYVDTVTIFQNFNQDTTDILHYNRMSDRTVSFILNKVQARQ